jgi:hypothetical protein
MNRYPVRFSRLGYKPYFVMALRWLKVSQSCPYLVKHVRGVHVGIFVFTSMAEHKYLISIHSRRGQRRCSPLIASWRDRTPFNRPTPTIYPVIWKESGETNFCNLRFKANIMLDFLLYLLFVIDGAVSKAEHHKNVYVPPFPELEFCRSSEVSIG